MYCELYADSGATTLSTRITSETFGGVAYTISNSVGYNTVSYNTGKV